MKSQKKLQIVVLGSSKAICTKKMYKYAYEVGKELAKKDCITLTGGGHGVMEAALKGAKEEGGQTVAILPWESMERVNDYADIVIATGIGWARDSINVYSAHGAIVVGGGAGTHNEVTFAYLSETPTVAIADSGGAAKKVANTYMDMRKTMKVYNAKTAQEAVKKVLKLIQKKEGNSVSLKDCELMQKEKRQNRKLGQE